MHLSIYQIANIIGLRTHDNCNLTAMAFLLTLVPTIIVMAFTATGIAALG